MKLGQQTYWCVEVQKLAAMARIRLEKPTDFYDFIKLFGLIIN